MSPVVGHKRLLTVATGALRNASLFNEASVGQTNQVLLFRFWKACREFGSTWLEREIESDNVLAIEVAL